MILLGFVLEKIPEWDRGSTTATTTDRSAEFSRNMVNISRMQNLGRFRRFFAYRKIDFHMLGSI
ncbi:MAG: hypothetical protein KDK38_16085 [Leptospiraceae bacterium]|nr:hypothetical protein [Leptospiraceae bacterium]